MGLFMSYSMVMVIVLLNVIGELVQVVMFDVKCLNVWVIVCLFGVELVLGLYVVL